MRRDPERRPIEALTVFSGGVPRRFWRVPEAESVVVSKPGSTSSTGPSKWPGRCRRGVAVEAHLEVGEQDAASADASQGTDGRAVRCSGRARPVPARTRPRTEACRPAGRERRGPRHVRSRPNRRAVGRGRSRARSCQRNRPGHAEPVARRRVGDAGDLDLEGGDPQHPLAERFDVEGRSAEPRLVVQGISAFAEAAGPITRTRRRGCSQRR